MGVTTKPVIRDPAQLDLVGSDPLVLRRLVMPPKPIITHREMIGRGEDWPEHQRIQGGPVITSSWLPQQPHLAWLALAPMEFSARTESRQLRDYIGRTYRLGFGGLVLISLYPQPSRSARGVAHWAKDLTPATRRAWVMEYARFTADLVRQRGCRTLCLVTGRLPVDWMVDDFRWFMNVWEVQGIHPGKRWMCLSVDDWGWPQALHTHGLTPVPATAALQPWDRSKARWLLEPGPSAAPAVATAGSKAEEAETLPIAPG